MKSILTGLMLGVMLLGLHARADVLAPPSEPVEKTITGKLVRVGDVSAGIYKVEPPQGVAVAQTQPLKRGESVLVVKTIKSIKELTATPPP